jgi:hypothetical protein
MPHARKAGQPPRIGDRLVYEEWLKNKKSNRQTAKVLQKGDPKAYPTRKQVADAVTRHENGTSAEFWTKKQKSNVGRLPVLDEIAIRILVDEEEERKRANVIVRLKTAECHEAIYRERYNMVVRLGYETSLATFDPLKYAVSERKLCEYRQLIWPETKNSKPVTAARERAKAEIRNAISCVAVAGSVFKRTNPSCILTSDHLACYLDKHSQIQLTHAAEGSQAAMRKQGLSIGCAADEFDSEGNVKLPCHCTFTKAGESVSVIAEIWDDQLRVDADGAKVKIYALDPTDADDFLSATSFTAYIAYGTPHDLVMWEMYSKVILPKGNLIRNRVRALACMQRQSRVGAAFGAAPSVAPVREASVSSASSKRSKSALSAVSANSVGVNAYSLRSTDCFTPKLSTETPTARSAMSTGARARFAAPELDQVFQPAPGVLQSRLIEVLHSYNSVNSSQLPAAVPSHSSSRSSSNSNGGRRKRQRSPEGYVSDNADVDVVDTSQGTWVNDPSEFDLVLALDGDSAPLSAFLEVAKMRSFKDKKHPAGRHTLKELIDTKLWGAVSLLKWAAGTSMLQSPNDAGKAHPIFRTHIKGKKGKPTKPLNFDDCPPGLQEEHRRLQLTDITPNRKRGFWRLLSNLPGAVAEAFRPRVIKNSWYLCGYYPLSEKMILDKCTLWRRLDTAGGLSDAEKMAVLAAIPRFQDIAAANGRVSDAEMEEALPFLRRYPVEKLAYDLADLAINRDRCCLILHDRYLPERALASAAAHAANADLRRPKARKPAAAENEDAEYEAFSKTSRRCTIPEIKHQLEIRGVVMGHAKTKDALLQLFKDNSDLPDRRNSARVVPAAAVGSLGGNVETLARLQAAIPPSPQPRARAASAPSTPVRHRTPPPKEKKKKKSAARPPRSGDPFALDDDTSFEAALPLTQNALPSRAVTALLLRATAQSNPLTLPAASPPPQRLTPRTQAALRAAGKPWLNQ